LASIAISVDRGFVVGVVNTEMLYDRPFSEPPNLYKSPSQAFTILGACYQAFPSYGFVLVVTLVPILANKKICTELGGVEMADSSSNSRVDYLWLQI
jgi:hypothetical protein